MAELHSALSPARFEAYRKHPAESDAECLRRYVWNVALCESIYPTLHYLEVALRNAIHNAATMVFHSDFWFDDPSVIDDHKTLKIIGAAKDAVRKKDRPLESGRIVAELHLGFWRTLFYAQYEKRLWRPIIKDVFPYAPKRMRQRTRIGPLIGSAQQLRNRVFHHEPVWYLTDLTTKHSDMRSVISWICPDLAALAAIHDRFPETFETDLVHLEPQLATFVT